MSSEPLQNLVAQASQFHAQGRLLDAEELYRAVLQREPNRLDARFGLGVLVSQTDRHAEAVSLLTHSIVMQSRSVLLMVTLGASLLATGNVEQSISCLRKSLEIDPACPEAHNTLGCAFLEQHRLVDAVVSFRNALKNLPNYPEAHFNLARALTVADMPDDAIIHYRTALHLNPSYAKAYLNLGFLIREKGDFDSAAECFRRAMVSQSAFAEPMHNLGVTLAEQGQVSTGISWLRRAVETDPANHRAASALVYLLQFDPETSAAQLAQQANAWHQRFAAPLLPPSLQWPNTPDPNRRLRIGYVSPDFRAHAECRFVLPLLQHHDATQFEVHCYSSVRKPDAITQCLQQLAHVWHDVRTLTDAQLATQIRHDQIDILIDLTMHMQDHRLLTFARKPAPVQMTWLAYPAGTGLSAIDYRITDAHLDPPNSPDLRPPDGYPEKPLRLPDAWFCYQPAEDAPPVSPLPASHSNVITFGSMNSYRKVSPPVLTLWCQVLQAVQAAASRPTRLLMICPPGKYRQDVLTLLASLGVDSSRVELLSPMKYADYMATISRLDIALDPFPHAGATTTCDALWMGVPTLSLRGNTPARRLGQSVLTAAGLSDWLALTPDQYVQKAIAFTRDLSTLAALRALLRQHVSRSPLLDAPRFARNFESAVRAAWRSWCDCQAAH